MKIETLRIENFFENSILSLLRSRDFGADIRVKLWNGREYELSDKPQMTVTIKQPAALLTLLTGNLGGIAEAYVKGDIDVDVPPLEAVRIFDRFQGFPGIRSLRSSTSWKPRRRTKKQDAKAIQFHYDVSNDFYQLFLDQQMVYSCAYFKSGEEDIDGAQKQKLDLICRKLMLKPGEKFLDIGCGWGALVRHAAKEYGVRATGVTLSYHQYEYAKQKIAEEGLEHLCRIMLLDYRELPKDEPFDKIASVGMFEHVGLANLPQYFQSASDLLIDGGLMLNHGICSNELDNRFAARGRAGNFIDRYVFPYAELPHVSLALREMCAQGFEVFDIESLRPHYAMTLSHWVTRLENQDESAKRWVGEERYRTWIAYLAGSAHAFERGWISVYQLLGAKRSEKNEWNVPLTREHLYKRKQLPVDPHQH